MASHSWETFGGRKNAQPGCNPQESDLLSWALRKGFVPVQAQAKLCVNQEYAPSSRRRMLSVHDFWQGACQRYNKGTGKANKISILKVFLNPMHLLVQQAYLEDMVGAAWFCKYSCAAA